MALAGICWVLPARGIALTLQRSQRFTQPPVTPEAVPSARSGHGAKSRPPPGARGAGACAAQSLN